MPEVDVLPLDVAVGEEMRAVVAVVGGLVGVVGLGLGLPRALQRRVQHVVVAAAVGAAQPLGAGRAAV